MILKMMFLLFIEDLASERELMKVIPRGSIIFGFSVTPFNACWREVIGDARPLIAPHSIPRSSFR
jgi:hypothetical protein